MTPDTAPTPTAALAKRLENRRLVHRASDCIPCKRGGECADLLLIQQAIAALLAAEQREQALRDLAERFDMACQRMSVGSGARTRFEANRSGQREAYFNCARLLREALAASSEPPATGEEP